MAECAAKRSQTARRLMPSEELNGQYWSPEGRSKVGSQTNKTSNPATAKPATSNDQSPKSKPSRRPSVAIRTLTEPSDIVLLLGPDARRSPTASRGLVGRERQQVQIEPREWSTGFGGVAITAPFPCTVKSCSFGSELLAGGAEFPGFQRQRRGPRRATSLEIEKYAGEGR